MDGRRSLTGCPSASLVSPPSFPATYLAKVVFVAPSITFTQKMNRITQYSCLTLTDNHTLLHSSSHVGQVGSKSCHTREEGADRHAQLRKYEGEASAPQHSHVDRRLEKALEHLVICMVEIVEVASHGARRGASWRDVARIVLSELRVLRCPRALQKVCVHDAVAHRQGPAAQPRASSCTARVCDY